MDHIPNLKYKTTICQKWEANQPCPKGLSCFFAHGATELRTVQQNQKSISQRNQFLKSYSEHYNYPSNYKTIKCKFYSKGKCQLGDSCTFYHSPKQKRDNLSVPTQPAYSYSPNWYPYPQYGYIPYEHPVLPQHPDLNEMIEEQLQGQTHPNIETETDVLKNSYNTELSESADVGKEP